MAYGAGSKPKTKGRPLTDDELIAAIEANEAQSIGPMSTEIAADRADAIDRYLGKPYGDEQTGRSAVISRDVSDVVEGVLANVLKPFVAGEEVVKFDPRGPEDEDAAQQETDYINFVALERNNGFLVLNAAVKDALLLRNGYIKCGWRVRHDIVLETYRGQSDDQLAMLMQDPDIEVVQHSEYPDPSFPQAMMPPPGALPPGSPGPQAEPAAPGSSPPPPTLHDVKVRRVRPTEYVEIVAAPPDEFLISQRTTGPSVQDTDFVQHRTHKTISYLRELGYTVPDDVLDGDDNQNVIEDNARQRFGSAQYAMWEDPTMDPSRRIVLFKESYIRIDRDGDGVAELRRVGHIGKHILDDEEADIIPIAAFTSVLMPHKHLGISVYDFIKDIAQIKTVLLRSYLDNRYLANNAEKVINVDAAPVIDDFLTSRPGGIKRVTGDPNTVVMPLTVPDTGAGALQALEYLDTVRENRTGFTRTSQGMDSESLASDTLGGQLAQLDQSQMRLEMQARTIAETGVRDLFRIIHALTLKYARKDEIVRLRNKWVTVDPREWVRRTDLSISVGLGSSSGATQVRNLQMIGQAQQMAGQMGLVTPKNIYETVSKLVTAAGFKNPEAFFTPPAGKPKLDPQTGQPVIGQDGKPEMESAPPPQQPPPEVQVEQMRGQTAMQTKQMELQSQGQQEQARAQATAAGEQARTQADMAIQQHKINTDAQIELQKFQLQLAADRDREAAERQLQVELANIKAAAAVEVARIGKSVDDGSVVLQNEMRDAYGNTAASFVQAVQGLVQEMQKPKQIIRDPNGRAVGIGPANGAGH